jgi:8-oxo-dGTP diphosphatase
MVLIGGSSDFNYLIYSCMVDQLAMSVRDLRCGVVVNSVIVGFDGTELRVLLNKIEKRQQECFIHGVVKESEDLQDAVYRVLQTNFEHRNFLCEQIRSARKPDDAMSRKTLIITYYAFCSVFPLSSDSCYQWYSLRRLPDLDPEDYWMIERSLLALRHRASLHPIGLNILPEKFTLRELQNLYEQIYNREIDRSNFRKRVIGLGLLSGLTEKNKSTSKKGSYLYTFNEENYRKFEESGFKTVFISL